MVDKAESIQGNICHRNGCTKLGKVRSIVDKVENCVWRYVLCDDCERVLLDNEKFAIARAKGRRN